MKAILIRHARVLFTWKPAYDTEGFRAACDGYDLADIERPAPKDAPFESLDLYVSGKRRSKETAALLFPQVEQHETANLDEVPIGPFAHTRKRVPLWCWFVLGRVQWYLNSRNQEQPRRETERLAREVIDRIEARGRDSVIVGHGLQFQVLLSQFKKRGWKVGKRGIIANLQEIACEKAQP